MQTASAIISLNCCIMQPLHRYKTNSNSVNGARNAERQYDDLGENYGVQNVVFTYEYR